jgi:hypothetical protein
MIRFVAFALFFPGLLAAEPPPSIDAVFDRMYRRDFSGAQDLLRNFIQRHPGDPLPHAVRSAAYLFSELDRLMILEVQFFGDDKRILEKKKVTPDPAIRTALFESIRTARDLATNALRANARDTNALFTLCIATGVQTDYLALIEKRHLGSLSYAKESHEWAIQLLAIEPAFHDAFVTTGLSEYLLGSMPFFVRWFIRFDQAQGSKSAAVRNLEIAARNGRYFRPFAKLLLAVIHAREKRLPEAEALLAELHQQFPENPLYKRELDLLVQRRNSNTYRR